MNRPIAFVARRALITLDVEIDAKPSLPVLLFGFQGEPDAEPPPQFYVGFLGPAFDIEEVAVLGTVERVDDRHVLGPPLLVPYEGWHALYTPPGGTECPLSPSALGRLTLVWTMVPYADGTLWVPGRDAPIDPRTGRVLRGGSGGDSGESAGPDRPGPDRPGPDRPRRPAPDRPRQPRTAQGRFARASRQKA